MYCLILMTFFTFISVRAFSGRSTFPITSLNPITTFTASLPVSSSLSRLSLNMRVKKSKGESIRAIAPHYVPKTGNQEMYVKYLEDERAKIVLGVGPAGSGKTLFACAAAISALRSGMIQKIVMTRPVVPVEEDIGFLPGSMLNKMDPWTRPIFDILGEFYSQKDIDSMLHSGTIDIVPLAYMRGRTFKRSFIIADEMQNSSPNQMLMIATRIGDESKMVITGDLKQSDRGFNNGLADLLGRLKKSGGADESIRFVELESADVQRSPIVRRILDIYSDEGGPRDKSLVDKSLVDKSLVDKSLVDKSLVDKSLVDKSLVDKSLEKPAVDKSLVDKSLVDKSLVDKSLVDKSLVDKSLEKPAVDKSSVDKSSVDKSSVDKSSVDKSSVDKSSVDKSSVDKSLVDKSSEKPAEKPAVDKSLEKPAVDKSSVDKSLEKPAVDKPAEKPTCAIVQKYRKPSNNDAAMMPLEHISKNMDKPL